jgi:alkylation response protein AidB-like acyl-CoA dehydrogenase
VDFEYTPEQIHLRRAVREFDEAGIAPFVREWIGEGTSEIQRLVIARQLLKT